MRTVHPITSAHVRIVAAINASFQDAYQFDDPTVTSWNLTGATFRMDIKRSYEDAAALVSFTSGAGQIVTDDAIARIIHFNVPDTTLTGAGIVPGEYVYDLIMTDTASVRTQLMHGPFCVGDGVTG